MDRYISHNYLIPLMLVVIGFIVFYLPMVSSSLLPGIDGPYYAVQVYSLIQYGYPKYLDPPITFYLFYLTSILSGDVFFGVKVGVSLFTALGVIPIYYLISKFFKSVYAAVTACIAFIFNPYIFRLIGDFMKNGVALVFLGAGIFFMFREKLSVYRRILLVMFFMLLTGLTHILVFIVFGLYLVLAAFFYTFNKQLREGVSLFMVVLLVLSLFIVFPLLTGNDIWKAFSIVNKILSSGIAFSRIRLDWVIFSLGIVFVSLVLGFYHLRQGDQGRAGFYFVNGLVCLIINFPLLPPNILFRTQLMTVVPLSYVLGGVVGRETVSLRRLASYLLLLVFLVSISIPSILSVRPSIPDGEYLELSRFVSGNVANSAFIVPDVRLKYWVETLTDNVFKKPDPTLFSDYDKVFLIVDVRSRFVPKDLLLVYDGKFIKVYEFRKFSKG